MSKEESFVVFYAELCDIANESFALGEKILESKIVWKIVRFLPNRF